MFDDNARSHSRDGRFRWSAFRAPLLVLCLVLIGLRASAQTLTPAIGVAGPAETQLFQWAVTQGGLVLVVLVVVWSYRRDFSRIFNVEKERTTELLLALQQSSSALAMHAELMRSQADSAREQAKAFFDLAGSVRTCEVVREVLKDQPTRNQGGYHD
ncbi:MAG: hypothetical protein ABFD60_01650 [Bryobacteraceae bacterium]